MFSFFGAVGAVDRHTTSGLKRQPRDLYPALRTSEPESAHIDHLLLIIRHEQVSFRSRFWEPLHRTRSATDLPLETPSARTAAGARLAMLRCAATTIDVTARRGLEGQLADRLPAVRTLKVQVADIEHSPLLKSHVQTLLSCE